MSEKSGGVLLSQGISPQVPSALAGLTAVFGMGTGVAPPVWPPGIVVPAHEILERRCDGTDENNPWSSRTAD